MEREIIKIDEDLCNGCGDCVPGCPEGALQIIDGKARLVSDLFCDGLGACIGECPVGAITIEKREAEPYDEAKVMENIIPQGEGTIKAHLDHLKDHGEKEFYEQALAAMKKKGAPIPHGYENYDSVKPSHGHHGGGCPGTQAMSFDKAGKSSGSPAPQNLQSELSQWPIQLQLINPDAPYFKEAELVVAADCVPFSFPNFHDRFLKGKKLVIFCPKLDTTMDQYIEKMARIFEIQDIKSVSILHMEVPCCGGVEHVVREAMKKADKNITLKDYTISIQGEII